MSKPGQGNARIPMYGGGRMPNPNPNHVHAVNNLPGNIFQQVHSHTQPPPSPSAQYNNYPRHGGPNNLQPNNPHLQQMPLAVSTQNGNNVQMNYLPQRPLNVPPNLQMLYPSPFGQYQFLQNSPIFNQPTGNMYYIFPQSPQEAPILPPLSQPQMPPIQQSHLYTQTNNYPPGPPQHQPAPSPTPQPQGPPAKIPPPKRDRKAIPIIDPKTNKNIMEDMEQQQTIAHATQQPREQQQTNSTTRQIEDLSHGSVQLYEREKIVSPEQQAPLMPHISHMMHHHHSAQPIRLMSHPSPSPPINSHPQILQRPHGGHHMAHSPPVPTRPSTTPSPVVQSTLVNDNIESLHSQPHVNSIPTVSALSTGREVHLADLNQKVLSSYIPNHMPNMISKNKHKTSSAVVPNLNSISSFDESPHHYVNSNSTPIVNNPSNPSPHLNNTSSYPINSNSSDQNPINYPNQTKFFPEVADTEKSHDSQYPEDGSLYFNQQNSTSQQAQKSYSNVSVLKRSASVSKSTSNENPADQSLSESNGHPAVSETSSCHQTSESQDQIQEQPLPIVQQIAPETILPPEPTEDEDSIVSNIASSLPVAQTQPQPQMKLKHSYQLDQWSPINQDGLKKYSRDFLLKLQNEAMSRPKPANLPDLEIVLKDLSKTNYAKNSPHNSFTPHYLTKPANIRQNTRQQPVLKTRSIQCGKVSKPASKSPNIVLSISLKEDIKLRESENAWRPYNTIDEDEKFYKQVRGVLNKLTPENFESLKQQFKDFPINTTKRLDKVIDLVFQKAIAEPSFSEFYAKICFEMMKKEVKDDTKPSEDGKHTSVNFKNLLLNKCQVEFERNETEERKNDIKLEEIKAEKDPEKQRELRLLFEEEERLIRKRSVGNCRFIGELYKLNMLTTFIMHNCLKQLLAKKEEEPLERACKLLSTIGKDLESHDKDPSQMKEYFNTMEELASKKNSHIISSRVRFMLQDVIDLRKNKWIPRRNENRPKTIQQIAYEAESEKFGMNLNKKSLLPSPTQLEGDRKAAFQMSQKDWKPHQPAYKANNFVIDKTKFAPMMRESPTDLKLGPSNKNVWQQGSSINKTSDSPWNFKPSSESNNFNPAFNSDIRTNKSSSYKSIFKVPVSAPTSTENRYSVLHHNSNMSSGSGKPELPISMRCRIRRESNETERALLDQLMNEKKNSCKILFDKYFCSNDFSNLLQSIQKLEISNIDLCYFAFEVGTQLSKKEYHRNISNLIIEIHKRLVPDKATICDAMRDFFQNTIENDLYTDTPYLSKYIAEIIAPLIEVDVISFSDLRSSTKCLKTEDVDFCLPLVRELLIILGFNKAPTWLLKKWNASDLKLSDFVANSEKLVHVYPFFFLGPMEQADFSTVIKVTCNNDLKTRIKDVIISHQHIPCVNVSLCVDLVNWTMGNFGSSEELSPGYFRALTSALCEISIIKNKEKLNSNDFSKYIHVYKLLKLTEDQEIEVLNSVFLLVQSLEFPQGLLLDCFKCLYQEGAILHNSFKLWSRADQTDSKGVALKQLHTFFQMLSEN